MVQNEAEKTQRKAQETIKDLYYNIPTEKNNLPSQHNLNNYNAYDTDNRKRSIGNSLREKTENSIMQTGLNCISPKLHNRHYKSSNEIEYFKYKENYIKSVETLKENFESPSINRNLKSGLIYNDIPRLDLNKKKEYPRTKLFCNSIEKAIKYDKSESNSKNLNEHIDEENFKLKNYMNNINKFVEKKENLDKEKFPNLMEIQKMKKITQENLILRNNRYMGERYDPLNYYK